MRKLASVGLITASEAAGAQVIDDTTARQFTAVQTSAGLVPVLGPIQYGKVTNVIHEAPASEQRNTVLIGGLTTEVITASTRYAVNIWNAESDYETWSQSPIVHAYTSPAVLSGNAATDRAAVYAALIAKINAYAANNVTAYPLYIADYTIGTSLNDLDTNFVVGEVVAQETSGETAQVAACVITGGTFAADSAAGKIYLYNISDTTAWLTTAKTLSAAGHVAAVGTKTPATSNCVVTVTNATTVATQGIVIVDDAGYFTSSKSRGGINKVGINGFDTATASVILAGRYPIGCGTFMLNRRPVFDMTGQVCLSGSMEYNFRDGVLPVAGQFYNKTTIEVLAGDVDAVSAESTASKSYHVVYINDATVANSAAFTAAIDTVAAK
jgi:hypothetical protein